MEIKLPLDAHLQAALNKVSAAFPELKLNQVLQAKIVVNQAQANLLTVNLAGKAVTLQTPLPLPIAAGQSLQLQVVKLLPTPEFKLIAPALPANANPTAGGEAPLLKLVPTPTPPQAAVAGNPLANLQLGQSVSAQVVSVGKQNVTLQLATAPPAGHTATDNAASRSLAQPITLDSRQLIETDPAKPALMPGNRIELQLVKVGSPPLFSAKLAPADSGAELVAAAFKQALPQQSSPQVLLDRLDRGIGELVADKTVGETLKHLALQILRAIPDKSALFQPAGLKTAVAGSGLFLEAKLAQAGRQSSAPQTLMDDFKLKLGKFIAELALELKPAAAEHPAASSTPLLRELLQQAEGSLAKLTLDQLHSLPKDDAPRQVWVLELPFLQNGKPDLLELVVEHERGGSGNPAGQNNWVVSITITPPELATIHCKLSCYDGSVNTRFWSESAETVEKINARLDYLRRQFEEKGLKPGFMDAQHGKPAQEHSPIASPQSLLSEKV
ncbi:flagellar hook-length control protein FliK [Methylomonas koyamae]|uniref:flagellar hook-length control protein FliK n=1 Tax=Methylomonas koyamae TaxID=702114 RepID=UPI002873C09B|nr:flagellar hook-length control protein FliK [Methylomonas koyamae]WNB78016.1 flagellar hook-length control protein FliK [Methylomonas koyamae]